MISKSLFSDSWNQATEKFSKTAPYFGDLYWCTAKNHDYDIPYLVIGDGPHKMIFLSGLNGLDALYGSAAQQLFLEKFAPNFSPEFRKQYTIVLVHVVNGYGMDNNICEIIDKNGNFVHLNRNFINTAEPIIKNTQYQDAHKLLVSRPDKNKMTKLQKYRTAHLNDGAWYAIGDGQYTHRDGLFYGGLEPVIENKMLKSIFDRVLQGAESAQAFSLQTGDGWYDDIYGNVSGVLQVLNPAEHDSAQLYRRMCWLTNVAIRPHYNINGNWAGAFERLYNTDKMPAFATDFFIGTKKTTELPHINKYLLMGNSCYERKKYGDITDKTKKELLNSFCPPECLWRQGALNKTYHFFQDIINYTNAQCKCR